MSANNTIIFNYQQAEQLVGAFDRFQDAIKSQNRALTSSLEGLRAGQWKADSANTFYDHLDNQLMPGLVRLYEAMGLAAQVTGELGGMFRAGEADAVNGLNGLAIAGGLAAFAGASGVAVGGSSQSDFAQLISTRLTGDSNALTVLGHFVKDLPTSLKVLGKGLPFITSAIDEIQRVVNKEDDPTNAFVNWLSGNAIDLTLDAIPGLDMIPVIAAAVDLGNLPNQLLNGAEQTMLNLGKDAMSPDAYQELYRATQYGNTVYQQGKLGNVLTDLKDMFNDVALRPAVNDFKASANNIQKFAQSGNPQDLFAAFQKGTMGVAGLLTTPVGVYNFLSDESARAQFMNHGANVFRDAFYFSQVEIENVAVPVRMGLGVVDVATNLLPDGSLKQNLHQATMELIKDVNKPLEIGRQIADFLGIKQ